MKIPTHLLPEDWMARLSCGCTIQTTTRRRFVPWVKLVTASEDCPIHDETMVGNQSFCIDDVEIDYDIVPYRVNIYIPNETAKSVELDVAQIEDGVFTASFKDIKHTGSFFEAVHGCTVEITELLAEMLAERFEKKEEEE